MLRAHAVDYQERLRRRRGDVSSDDIVGRVRRGRREEVYEEFRGRSGGDGEESRNGGDRDENRGDETGGETVEIGFEGTEQKIGTSQERFERVGTQVS